MQQLESMDTDGDQIITLTEMKVFFQARRATRHTCPPPSSLPPAAPTHPRPRPHPHPRPASHRAFPLQLVSPSLEDGTFQVVIDEMDELAQEAAVIANCIKEADAPPTTLMEIDVAVKPTLPASRQELLGKLFGLFSDDATSGSINVAALENCELQEGPYKVKLLKDLKAMDANSDGQLTLEEMTDYLAALGAALSDEECELIIGEMYEACSTNQLAQLSPPSPPRLAGRSERERRGRRGGATRAADSAGAGGGGGRRVARRRAVSYFARGGRMTWSVGRGRVRVLRGDP